MKAWETNAAARKILAGAGLDTDPLLVNTVVNTVFIKGSLRFLAGPVPPAEGLEQKLHEAEDGIKSLEGVEHISWDIKGWRTREGKWERSS